MFSSTGMPTLKALFVTTFLLVAATVDALPTLTAAVEEAPTNIQRLNIDSMSADADDADKATATEAPIKELTTMGYEDSADEDTPSTQEAVNFLAKYGYLARDEQNNTNPLASMDLSQPLKMMQRFAGLEETGKLDAATARAMRSRRCGVSDNARDGMLAKRYQAIRSWRKKLLFYKRNNMPTHTLNLNNPSQVDAVVTRSLKHWSDVADLKVEDVGKNNNRLPDINIDFIKGRHGDGSPFDGRGTVLAHAYTPPDGRLHMDDDEMWSIDAPVGSDMHQVMTHELGHTLGLNHSTDRSAVMFAYFRYRSNFKLAQDDVEGIQYLYGAKKGSDKTTRSRRTLHTGPSITTTTTTTNPNIVTIDYFGGDYDDIYNRWMQWIFGNSAKHEKRG